MTAAPFESRGRIAPALWFLIATLTLSSLSAETARAQLGGDNELTMAAANRFEFYWNSELEETVLDDRLDWGMRYGPFSVGAVFLSHTPSDAARLDPRDYGPEFQGIRKRWVTAETSSGDVYARLGDVYATFGRGLSLSIFEDQTVDFDNVLDGVFGRAMARGLDLQVIGGTNSYDDPYQTIKGAELTYELPKGHLLGVEGVWSDSTGTETSGRPGGDRLFGGHLGGSLSEYVDYYGEYVVRDYKNFREGATQSPQGHGGYGNLILYGGPVQILAEYKDFLRYDLDYINPPTANRSHASTLFNRASHVANLSFADERGGLVEAYLTLLDTHTLTASYGESASRHSDQQSWEAYGEGEFWFGHTEIVLRGGEVEETIREGSDDVFFEYRTFSTTWVQPVTDVWSFEITGELQFVQESNRSTADYVKPYEHDNQLISATMSKSPNMSWALTYEWSDTEREDRDNWVWAEWNMQVGSRHQLLLGAGQLRGGQLCSGGVCKLVDPFEGARIEFLTTF